MPAFLSHLRSHQSARLGAPTPTPTPHCRHQGFSPVMVSLKSFIAGETKDIKNRQALAGCVLILVSCRSGGAAAPAAAGAARPHAVAGPVALLGAPVGWHSQRNGHAAMACVHVCKGARYLHR